MPWRRFQFRDQVVFVRVLDTGKPIVRRGLVEMRYKLGASKSYRSGRDNIEEIEGDSELISDAEFGGSAKPAAGNAHVRETPKNPPDEHTIVIYTDGACSGNPGPAGLGVLIQRPDKITEIAEFLGSATNNYAELMAILRGLENLSEDERKGRIHLYTDSSWCLGALIGGWKIKANVKVVEQIKELLPQFEQLELLKIKGHAGHPGNEMADELAVMAVRREDSRTRERPRRK